MGLDSIASATQAFAGVRPETLVPFRNQPASDAAPPPEAKELSKPNEQSAEIAARSEMDEAAAAVNEKLFRINRRMVLYTVDGTNEIAAKIVDTTTNEVVDSIPPEALLKFRARLRELRGVFVDKGA